MLKGYVRAGCCIGDGAVIDRQFGTTDVFIYFPLSGLDAALQEPLRSRKVISNPLRLQLPLGSLLLASIVEATSPLPRCARRGRLT